MMLLAQQGWFALPLLQTETLCLLGGAAATCFWQFMSKSKLQFQLKWTLFFLNKNLFKWNQVKNQLRVIMEELPVYTWPGGDVHKLASIWERWPFTMVSLSPSWSCPGKSTFSVPLKSGQILKRGWEKWSSLCCYKVNVDFSKTCLFQWRMCRDSLIWCVRKRLIKAFGTVSSCFFWLLACFLLATWWVRYKLLLSPGHHLKWWPRGLVCPWVMGRSLEDWTLSLF